MSTETPERSDAFREAGEQARARLAARTSPADRRSTPVADEAARLADAVNAQRALGEAPDTPKTFAEASAAATWRIRSESGIAAMVDAANEYAAIAGLDGVALGQQIADVVAGDEDMFVADDDDEAGA